MSERTQTEIIITKKPDLKNPIFVEGLTGIGHIGRSAVSYLIDKLGAIKFGEIYSNHFPHIAIVNDSGEMELLTNELYYLKSKGKQPDIIFLTGHTQSITPEGHYEVAYKIVDLIRQYNVKELITIGGYGVGDLIDDPLVLGIPTNKKLKSKYEKFGVIFEHSVGQVVGATGLLLAVGKRFGLNGVCLLGETPGFLLSDPKATEKVLNVLERILNIKIDYTDLNKKIKEAEKVIKKVQELQGQILQNQKGDKDKDTGYIG